ncbi:hypothetical protein JHL17_11610 [Azospirillum sp. YIM B02556]|uniref:Uncharacterized protein n=1 Tax=Azospirillum endophyticum TaxID=2800326 RepID=A0ABS1F3Q9_9PROT|nr:hypothetical protein [Azospirillum endophyticum]MBK1838061.1 hypothetical protein [Azospirillum endophyticum]
MPNRDMTGTGGPNPTGSTTGSSTTGSSTAGSSTTGGGVSGGRSGVDEMKKTVNRAADDVISTGRETLGNAQGRIRSLLEQQTGRAADQLGGVANALHKAAEQLNEENGGVVADYAEQAASRVERVADMLRDANVDDIVGEVEGFARRQPEVFIGAAFAVGFLAARFIKSSGERRMHRASTSRQGNAHPSQTVRTARGSAYDSGRDLNRDTGRSPSRGMAGGIGESVSRSTPSHSADTPTTGSSAVNTGNLAGRMDSERGAERLGEPKPAAGRIGMPLSTAPASVTGHGTAPSADTALGTSTVGSAGSTANAGTTGIGGAAGTTSTSKPQGQRP